MKKIEWYILGILESFGTLRPETNEFVFQTYDESKLKKMELIRNTYASNKEIKQRIRKVRGVEKEFYTLHFTSKELAGIKRQFTGIYAENVDFMRAYVELHMRIKKDYVRFATPKIAEPLGVLLGDLNGKMTFSVKQVKKIIQIFDTNTELKDIEFWENLHNYIGGK